MTDPETDRIQYLLQQREECAMTDAEQTELAIYKAEGKVESVVIRTITPATGRPWVIDFAQPAIAITLGFAALAFGGAWFLVIGLWFYGLATIPAALNRSEPAEDQWDDDRCECECDCDQCDDDEPAEPEGMCEEATTACRADHQASCSAVTQ